MEVDSQRVTQTKKKEGGASVLRPEETQGLKRSGSKADELIARSAYNKVLFQWSAPERITYDKNAAKFVGTSGILLLLGLYFLWIGRPFFTVMVAAMFFVYYVLTFVPARKVKHSIEMLGIRSFGQLYPWEDLVSFWFAERAGRLVLYVDTRLNVPSRLFFVVNSGVEAEEIFDRLIRFIPYRKLSKKQWWLERYVDGEYIPPEGIVSEERMKKIIEELGEEKEVL